MIKFKLAIFLLCFALCSVNKTFAQQPAYTYYSIREGIAANDIYNCLVDKKGFLWLATENGVSKFDGRNFVNYSVAQGLPDNDILSVEMDSAGVIWVLPFQKSPAYYDDKKDKFINSSTDAELKKIAFSNVNYFNALLNGGIGLCNSSGQVFIYKNKKCETFFSKNPNGSFPYSRIIELKANKYLLISSKFISILENGKIIKSTPFVNTVRLHSYINDCLYVSDSLGISKMQILPNGNFGKITQTELPFLVRGLNFTGKQIAIASATGNIYFADTSSLEIKQQSFAFNSFPRFVLEDKKGNTWICTKENGLIRYQQKGILSLSNSAFQGNFNTVSFLNNNIIAGTNNGESILYTGPYSQVITSLKSDKSFTSWVTKMVTVKNGVLIGSEGGFYFLNNNNQKVEIFGNPMPHIANKDFVVVNDSILFAGNSSNVYRVNYVKQKILDVLRIRVTTLQNIGDSNLYIGSNTGLYKWQKLNDKIYFGETNSILSTRVTALAFNRVDNLIWVGLANDTIVGMQNDKVVVKIPFGNKLSGNISKAVYSNKKGVLWVGTNAALARINYGFKANKIDYFIEPFTTADGIAGKQINDIVEKNDTIYVATTSGISIIPSNLNIDVSDIPIYITNVKINNIDTTIQKKYILKSGSNNIVILFSAPDLGSSTERLYQYSINNNEWKTLTTEKIELFQQSPGTYSIQIRAINRDGNPSKISETLTIKIKSPLIKSFWFWGLIALILGVLIFYFTQKNNKRKRERVVQQLLTEKKLTDLELRALKAQINPHFVFNCLNSIKYLNHQKRFKETDLYLDKFSYLLRKTLDFSGLQKITLEEELDYSKNYLELEKLRLGDKLNYSIIIKDELNTAEILVPPMLFQPYLENAIKHGIRHLQNENGFIKITTEQENNKTICVIEDNGVGIKSANALNQKDISKPTSHGLTLQQRRANLYNVDVHISNATNGKGTIVKLNL